MTPTAPPIAACSGVLVLNMTSALTISDGPDNYRNSVNCTWVILASAPITLRFSELVLEMGADYVKLYDGTSKSAPSVKNFTGTYGSFSSSAYPALPAAVTSTGNALTVIFTSDQTTPTIGFVATLTSSTGSEVGSKLVGTVPAALGDLHCIGDVTRLCVRPRIPERRSPNSVF